MKRYLAVEGNGDVGWLFEVATGTELDSVKPVGEGEAVEDSF